MNSVNHYPKCYGLFLLILLVFKLVFPIQSYSQGDGFIIKDDTRLLTLGGYHVPESDAELEAMAEAGFNLFRCRNRSDLDRVHAVGAKCWVSLPLEQGATDELKEKVNSLKDHPALALWEARDEFLSQITAGSAHLASFNLTRDDWYNQEERAVRIAQELTAEKFPKVIEAIELVRRLDDQNRQILLREIRRIDLQYMRQIMDYFDILGTGSYAVYQDSWKPNNIGRPGVGRFKEIGLGKPVWMNLMAFSWAELREDNVTDPVYPAFDQSRFMAYSAILHGARGVNYWGYHLMESDEFSRFHESWLSLISEISQLQVFLTGPELPDVTARNIHGSNRNYLAERALEREGKHGVQSMARRFGRDWIVILVNEDNAMKLGVDVSGLNHLDG